MESNMLSTIEFELNVPTSFRFLERFAKVCGAEGKLWYLARYLIELPLIEQRMLQYCPSIIAASALYLAIRI